MPELFGSVQRVELSATLWLLPLLPLLAALANALAGLRRPPSRGASRRITQASFGALLGAGLLAVFHMAKLFELPEGSRHLYGPGWQLVRMGSISLDFGLALDPLSGALALMFTTAGALLHLRLVGQGGRPDLPSRAIVGLHLGLASLLVLALADGFLPLFFGWQGVALSSLLFATHERGAFERAFVAHRIGDIGFLLAMAVLLWGLGGRWLPDGVYQPDSNPRFVAVVEKANDPEGVELVGSQRDPTLSFTAFPGARLAMDNAPLGVSPIQGHRVEPGRHSFVIEKSPADSELYEINWLPMNPNSETAIVPLGPTLVFRHLRDQLGLRDESGRHIVYEALSTKRLFGTSLLTLACLFLALPLLSQAPMLASSLQRDERRQLRIALPGVLALLGSACLLVRSWFLFSTSPRGVEIVFGSTALFAIACVWMRKSREARSAR